MLKYNDRSNAHTHTCGNDESFHKQNFFLKKKNMNRNFDYTRYASFMQTNKQTHGEWLSSTRLFASVSILFCSSNRKRKQKQQKKPTPCLNEYVVLSLHYDSLVCFAEIKPLNESKRIINQKPSSTDKMHTNNSIRHMAPRVKVQNWITSHKLLPQLNVSTDKMWKKTFWNERNP